MKMLRDEVFAMDRGSLPVLALNRPFFATEPFNLTGEK